MKRKTAALIVTLVVLILSVLAVRLIYETPKDKTPFSISFIDTPIGA
jgi:hypothetical protein